MIDGETKLGLRIRILPSFVLLFSNHHPTPLTHTQRIGLSLKLAVLANLL